MEKLLNSYDLNQLLPNRIETRTYLNLMEKL